MSWNTPPASASLSLKPFKAEVPEQDLQDFKQLLKLSKIGPKTYENLRDDRYFGISREWLAQAKEHWETKHDWRKTEGRLNAFPNFTTSIEYQGSSLDIHFIALFSKKKDAVPLLFLHGWPGSVLEFLEVLELLTSKYTPETLPFNVVVPSLPGYGYSTGPPLDMDFKVEDTAAVLDSLMIGLGFGAGYVSQGGDIGSFLSRVLAVSSDTCKTVHLNLCVGITPPHEKAEQQLSESERKAWSRAVDFATLGNAYAREHGTRPATIGLTLSSSPVALLAWIGEKFLVWTDQDPSFDQILDSVTLYWFTESFPRSIYPYRQFFGASPTFFHNAPEWYIKKPFGYSWFPMELAPVPKDWVATSGNLAWFKAHTGGGHFAAMEKPQLFVEDMESFVSEIWPKVK